MTLRKSGKSSKLCLNLKVNHEPVPTGGLSVSAFARLVGVSDVTITKYCKHGRIFGARQNRLTGRWCIYPPAKLLFP